MMSHPSPSIQTRRIHDAPDPSHGQRVLVDRLWPRGISRERANLAEWCRDVSPSHDLRTWYEHDPAKYGEFVKRYQAELDHRTSEGLRPHEGSRQQRATHPAHFHENGDNSHASRLHDLLMTDSTSDPPGHSDSSGHIGLNPDVSRYGSSAAASGAGGGQPRIDGPCERQ
jgi:uncharacterized protein YeaO (DUF488 family)